MHILDYKPKAYHVEPDHEDMDIDASNAGDYIVCPVHPEEIIYVFGTNFWKKEGGKCSYGWASLTLKDPYCSKCSRYYRVNVGSYGG